MPPRCHYWLHWAPAGADALPNGWEKCRARTLAAEARLGAAAGRRVGTDEMSGAPGVADTSLAARMDRFGLTHDQLARLRGSYRLLLENVDLSLRGRLDPAQHPMISGIYCWILHLENRGFGIYVGRTRSIAARLANYGGEFQPHSPNDYKLRLFQDFVKETDPQARMDLHFLPQPIDALKIAEKEEIAAFDPMLNRRHLASQDSRDALKRAFARYYRSAFERTLG